MDPLILVLNPGSSSIKAKLFGADFKEVRVWKEPVSGESGFSDALNKLLGEALSAGPLQAVGCRVVDGGPDLREACLASDEVVATLKRAAQVAPLHSGESLEVIRVIRKEQPELPLVLAFDTAFHRSLPQVATTYPLPKKITDSERIGRMGFHGLAYQSVVSHLSQANSLPRRLLAVHLGSGCSACAILDGKSVDTTMGFTPLEGLMMGTRSGSIDPGILLYLLDKGYDSASLSRMLNRESGLLGVSGISADVRELERDARLGKDALELFCYLAAKQVAALVVAMGGVDGLSFSGGIGENSSYVRAEVCLRLSFLGFEMDSNLNGANEFRISKTGLPILIVPVDEELEIAREAQRLLAEPLAH